MGALIDQKIAAERARRGSTQIDEEMVDEADLLIENAAFEKMQQEKSKPWQGNGKASRAPLTARGQNRKGKPDGGPPRHNNSKKGKGRGQGKGNQNNKPPNRRGGGNAAN